MSFISSAAIYVSTREEARTLCFVHCQFPLVSFKLLFEIKVCNYGDISSEGGSIRRETGCLSKLSGTIFKHQQRFSLHENTFCSLFL